MQIWSLFKKQIEGGSGRWKLKIWGGSGSWNDKKKISSPDFDLTRREASCSVAQSRAEQSESMKIVNGA